MFKFEAELLRTRLNRGGLPALSRLHRPQRGLARRTSIRLPETGSEACGDLRKLVCAALGGIWITECCRVIGCWVGVWAVQGCLGAELEGVGTSLVLGKMMQDRTMRFLSRMH